MVKPPQPPTYAAPELQKQITKAYFGTLLPLSALAITLTTWAMPADASPPSYYTVALILISSAFHYLLPAKYELYVRIGSSVLLIVFAIFMALFGHILGIQPDSRQLSLVLILGPLTVFSWGLIFADRPMLGRFLGVSLSFALTFVVYRWDQQGIRATDTFFPLLLLACLIGVHYTSTISKINQRFLKESRDLRLDPLTGLNNRRAFDESHSQSSYIAGGYLAVLDIDHFKKINDTYGHRTGDDILRAVTEVMQQVLMPYAQVYRWGGEEFVAIITGLTRKETDDLLNTVRQTIEARRFLPEHRVTLSIGLSRWYPEEPIAEVFDRADEALFMAKTSGRNKVVWK